MPLHVYTASNTPVCGTMQKPLSSEHQNIAYSKYPYNVPRFLYGLNEPTPKEVPPT